MAGLAPCARYDGRDPACSSCSISGIIRFEAERRTIHRGNATRLEAVCSGVSALEDLACFGSSTALSHIDGLLRGALRPIVTELDEALVQRDGSESVQVARADVEGHFTDLAEDIAAADS